MADAGPRSARDRVAAPWWPVARALWRAQLADGRGKLLLTVCALSVGVALIATVYLVNATALGEFDSATRELVGRADLIVRGPRGGFDEQLYASLVRAPVVAAASPVLEVEAALPDGRTLSVLGVDPLRLAGIQRALGGALAPHVLALLDAHAIVLSDAAAAGLALKAGDALTVRVGARNVGLAVIAVLPDPVLAGSYGVMDLGSAQWTFGATGRLTRIDLKVAATGALAAARTALAPLVPAGVDLTTPDTERDRAGEMSLAYRVNLNMLALVALLTGAFLVYSTQSLAVLRRRTMLGLLRALGVTRRMLTVLLVAEGALMGTLGGIVGTALGWAGAALLLRRFGADLGGGYFRGVLSLALHPYALTAFVAMGTLVAALGAWLPARAAVAVPPAQALKSGANPPLDARRVRASVLVALLSFLIGALSLLAPWPVDVPLGGYVAIACFLLAGLSLVPFVARLVLSWLPVARHPVLGLARAQVQGNAVRSDVSLAALIISFSLMVAMSIMVHSFRDSFISWLDGVLPADLNLRVPLGSTSAGFDPAVQAEVAALAGVSRVEFRRVDSVLLSAEHPPVSLIARPLGQALADGVLPLVRSVAVPAGALPVYVSEAIVDLYGWQPGQVVTLPLAGRAVAVTVAGVWRDYARSFGAIVIDRDAYVRLTGERGATEAALWLKPGTDAAAFEQRLRALVGAGGRYEVLATTTLKARSLELFDRAFAVTYLLEAIAVGLGLLGVSFAFSSQALARRAEFGVLRHLGLRRLDVAALVAAEGAAMGLTAVLYGLALGAGLSLVLIYVINRQSFHWSVDLHWPVAELAAAAVALVAASALTAALAARAATGARAVSAVREDW